MRPLGPAAGSTPGRRAVRSTSDARRRCISLATSARASPRLRRSPTAVSSRPSPSCDDGARQSHQLQKPSVHPRSCRRQHTSTSSPAVRNCGSNPPMATSASFLNAIEQPGMCSASLSDSSTWTGPPGAFATQSAIHPSPSGPMFQPPSPTCVVPVEFSREVRQPMRIGTRIAVGVSDDRPGRRLQTSVSRLTQSVIRVCESV